MRGGRSLAVVVGLLVAATVAVADPFRPLEARGAPLLINARGCSGSTITMSIANELLARLGVKAISGGWSSWAREHHFSNHNTSGICAAQINSFNSSVESFKIKKNCFFTAALEHNPETAQRAFVEQTAEAISRAGGTWVANPTFHWAQSNMTAAVVALGGRVVSMARANVLERFACQVRDCFPGAVEIGQSIDATTGMSSKLCFERRQNKNGTIEIKADIYVKDLVARLRQALLDQRKDRGMLTSMGFVGVQSLTYEALTAFEHGDLQRSALEWAKVFASWGLARRVPLAWVEAALRDSEYNGSRSAPSAAS